MKAGGNAETARDEKGEKKKKSDEKIREEKKLAEKKETWNILCKNKDLNKGRNDTKGEGC